jgi:hypothetical protein
MRKTLVFFGCFQSKKGMTLEIRIDAKMLLVQDILFNKNKKEDSLYNPH